MAKIVSAHQSRRGQASGPVISARVTISSAGIVLASDDPCAVQQVITLSRASYRKMIQNIAFSRTRHKPAWRTRRSSVSVRPRQGKFYSVRAPHNPQPGPSVR
ncbi:conserved hypothetical protein [Frankia sp. Hr75.2]|nr:conserved hypothetical protein [Frankia sp. Hr75.2]